jgi:hypothetical protein
MQPANQSRVNMFGAAAPVWPFLQRFGGAADPLRLTGAVHVMETYPVLTLIALGWLLPGRGALPKYNPQRTKTFSLNDWRFVCESASHFFASHSAPGLAAWLTEVANNPAPRKSDQDRLDACLCLMVAIWLYQGRECLMTGNTASGYIVVPHEPSVLSDMAARCQKTGLSPGDWTKVFRMGEARGVEEDTGPTAHGARIAQTAELHPDELDAGKNQAFSINTTSAPHTAPSPVSSAFSPGE